MEDLEYKRVAWRCRRGMLELDLLLVPFFERSYRKVSPEEQELFLYLLESEDQDLFQWLTQKASPTDPKLQAAVKLVLEAAKNNHA